MKGFTIPITKALKKPGLVKLGYTNQDFLINYLIAH